MANERWIYLNSVNVRAKDETEQCYITGMAMINGRKLAAIDQNNKSVKLIDVIDDVILGCIRFETIPYSITVSANNRLSVTFPSVSLIRILSTSPKLALFRTFNVNSKCVATTFSGGKLYVSYKNPTKFEILNEDGNSAAVITPEEQSLKLFKIPRYFTISETRKRIYVTDTTCDVILCLKLDGELINSYKEDNIDQPHGITMATKSDVTEVFVCNRNKHNVLKFDENLNKTVPIIGKADGLRYPTSICMSPSMTSLYISSASNKPEVKNVVRRYSLVRAFHIESIEGIPVGLHTGIVYV